MRSSRWLVQLVGKDAKLDVADIIVWSLLSGPKSCVVVCFRHVLPLKNRTAPVSYPLIMAINDAFGEQP